MSTNLSLIFLTIQWIIKLKKNKMKNRILLNCLAIFITAVSFGQTAKISGTILDEKSNSPVEFATIKVLKNNVFTISNKMGEFSLQAKNGDKIEISHVSYKTKRVALQHKAIIKLQSVQIELSEIIVAANPLQDISQSTVINDASKRISQPRSVGHLFK